MVPLCHMSEIWNTAFLKRHDMSGFSDNSFLFSVGMSGFCNIVFQKWRGLSEISHISLNMCNSLSQIWDTIMPGVQKSALNLGQDVARYAMTLENSETILPGVQYERLKSGTRKCPVCISLSEI